jgi:hypothetical protein
MTHILIDSIANLSVHNGVLRIECMAVGSDGKPHPSGTLIIPGAAANQVLGTLVEGTKELSKKMHEQAQMPAAGNA